jgi:hypothetical protein
MRDLHTEAHKRRTFPLGCLASSRPAYNPNPNPNPTFGAGYAAVSREMLRSRFQ